MRYRDRRIPRPRRATSPNSSAASVARRAAAIPFVVLALHSCGDGTGPDNGDNGGSDGFSIVQGTELSLSVGQSQQLAANGASGSITWTSDNTAVATVSPGGLVVAQSPGDALVTATNQNRSASISVTVENQLPVANAGDDQSVEVGDLVTLDGTGSSDPDGAPLSFDWTMVGRPAGSTATLSNPTSPNPSFTPDEGGAYDIELIVNDGVDDSAPDAVQVLALVSACSATTRDLDHGIVFVGSGQTDRSVTFQNSGTTDLSFSIGLSGSGAFSIVSGGGAVTLAPSTTHTVTVRFAPTDSHPGSRSATLQTGGSICGTVAASGTGGVTWTKVQQLMSTVSPESCQSCHAANGGPALTHAFVSTRINVGNPASSVFLTYPVSGFMFGGTVVDEWKPGTPKYALVFAWIEQGGLNN